MSDLSLVSLPWRTGKSVGRTIYAMTGPEPSGDDPLIGMMDTRELAESAVTAHNALLEQDAAGCE